MDWTDLGQPKPTHVFQTAELVHHFRGLVHLGLTDAFRVGHPEPHRYSDLFLLSPQATDRLVACDIDREPRGREKASDHTPVWCEIT